MVDEGFDIVCDTTILEKSKITFKHLAPRFKHISEKDIVTSGVFIQGRKNASTCRTLGDNDEAS
jgi:hypothetical protein